MNVLPTRRERRRERTLNAILDAAESHFLDAGFEDAKVDAIADDADVAVGSIYNYFGSKDGLYAAVLDRAVDLFELYLAGEPELELSALERVLDTVGRVSRFAREHPGRMRLLSNAGSHERAVAALAASERRTAALIEAAIRDGSARPVDARDAAAFLWAAWRGALTLGPRAERAAPGSDRDLQALLEAGLRLIVGGLASDAARGRDDTVRALLEGAPARRGEQLALRRAPVTRELRERFPELALWTVEVDATPRPTPDEVSRRLHAPVRPAGSAAIGTHGGSAPWAYKVFLRRLGMDPDVEQTDVERIVLGGPRTVDERGLPWDALAVAAIETGVPVFAFDAALVEGTLWLREARDGELVAGEPVTAGVPVLADDTRPTAVVFGRRDADVSSTTTRVALAALQVKGIPDVSVEQALWTTIEIIRERG